MEEYYTTEECAAILKVSPKTLETWRSRGKGPKYYKVGGRVLYKKSDIETRYDDLLKRQGKMQDRLGELEAANKELKSAQADFDAAVQDAAYKATKKAAMAGKSHQAISKELQVARDALKRLEEFVKRPEVRQLYERFALCVASITSSPNGSYTMAASRQRNSKCPRLTMPGFAI